MDASNASVLLPHILWGRWLLKKNFDINPYPDFPPYVVKILHFVELRLRWNTNTAYLDS